MTILNPSPSYTCYVKIMNTEKPLKIQISTLALDALVLSLKNLGMEFNDALFIFAGKKLNNRKFSILVKKNMLDLENDIIQTVLRGTKQISKSSSALDYIQENLLREKLGIFSAEALPRSLDGWLNFHAEHNPALSACSSGSYCFTYKELNARANQLARYIYDNYAFDYGEIIPIIGGNNIDTLICMLAILKTGAAFALIEPNQPVVHIKNKLKFIFKEKNPSLILCNQTEIKSKILETKDIRFLNERAPFTIKNEQILDIQDKTEEISHISDENFYPEDEIDDNNLAYILFTSGSTSTEKAVKQTRLGLLGQMLNYATQLGITSNDELLQISAISHDQAICNIFGSLFSGAGLYFYDLQDGNFKKLAQFIERHPVTIFTSIPSIFSALVELDSTCEWAKGIRLIRLGGEAVTKDHLNDYIRISEQGCQLGILYGATECSFISYALYDKEQAQALLNSSEEPSLGELAPHVEYFLEEGLEEIKDAHLNQLCIYSPFMCQGYYQDDEKNHKTFIPKDGKLYYRTGDLTYLKDGHLKFAGRSKGYIKINGIKINLSQIENILLENFPIKQCIIIPITQHKKIRLHALYLKKLHVQFSFNQKEITSFLAQHVQSFAIPVAFYELENLPKLPNGKTDRLQLEKIVLKNIEQASSNFMKQDLHIVDKILHEVIGWTGLEDEEIDLKSLGITSLENQAIISLLNRHLTMHQTNKHISFSEFIENQSIRKLKTLVDSKINSVDNPPRSLRNINMFQVNEQVYQNPRGPFKFTFKDAIKIANHYSQKYGISITPCHTKAELKEHILNFMKNPSDQPIGLFFPGDELFINWHIIPFILYYQDKVVHCFLGDSLGNTLEAPYINDLNDLSFFSKETFILHRDCYARQRETECCFTEALTWLIRGLRLGKNFIEQTTLLPARYDFPIPRFLSAPDQLVTSQGLEFPNDLPIPLNIDQINLELPNSQDSNKISLRNYLEKFQRIDTFEQLGSPDQKIQITYNGFIVAQSEKFYKIAHPMVEQNRD